MAAAEEEPRAAAAAGDAADTADVDADAGPGASLLLAGNRLSLDLYPGGCRRLLRLCARRTPQLLRVEFLQLSGHEDPRLLGAALAQVPRSLPHLRSLVLKGEPTWSQPSPTPTSSSCPCSSVLKGQPHSQPPSLVSIQRAQPSSPHVTQAAPQLPALQLPSGGPRQTAVCTLARGRPWVMAPG